MKTIIILTLAILTLIVYCFIANADEIKVGLVKEQFDTFERIEGGNKTWHSGFSPYGFPYKIEHGETKRTLTNIWLTDEEYNQLKNEGEVVVEFNNNKIKLFLEGKYEVPDDYIYGYDVLPE